MEPVTRSSEAVAGKPGSFLPRLSRGLIDCLVFSSVYLVAGRISLGCSFDVLLTTLPMVAGLMFGCMVVSGVYATKIQAHNLLMLLRTLLAFALATVPVLVLVDFALPEHDGFRFGFFFLFLGFIVMNTLQPLMSAGEKRRAALLVSRQSLD